MILTRVILILVLTCFQKVVLSDVKDECIEKCEQNLLECLLECDDDNKCASECNRESIVCIESKPSISY